MKPLSFAGFALLMLSVESVVAKSLGLEATRIDVGLALVVWVGVRSPLVEGAVSAFAMGYLLDVFTGRPTGLFTFLAVLVFLLVRLAAIVIDGRTRASYGLLVGAVTVVHALLALAFTMLTASGTEGHVLSLQGVPLQVLLTVVAGQVLWKLLLRLEAGERPDPGGLR